MFALRSPGVSLRSRSSSRAPLFLAPERRRETRFGWAVARRSRLDLRNAGRLPWRRSDRALAVFRRSQGRFATKDGARAPWLKAPRASAGEPGASSRRNGGTSALVAASEHACLWHISLPSSSGQPEGT